MPRPPIARTLRGAAALIALALGVLLGPPGGHSLAAAAASARRALPRPARSAPRVLASVAVKRRRKRAAALKFTLGPGLLAAPGVEVDMQPVGLSIEYPVMAAALGSGACPPPALAAELDQLGSPPIQLAGVSQDMTAPSGALQGQQVSWQTATLYSLPAAFWSQLHCLLETSMDPLTVGLNLRTGSAAWAQQMVSEARGAAVAGLSFSLGNEPDLYGIPNYASLDKPLPEEELAAVNLFIQVAGALDSAALPGPLVGPELALPERWRAQLPRVLKGLHYQTVGVHLYPLTACATPRDVTIPGLLSTAAADSPARLAWVVADAEAEGLPAIISEANSASCGGVSGVSNSPAAAVWAARFVLSALQTGFREVRFHLSGNSYDPFLVRGSTVLRRPLESALVALNGWLPVGSALHRVPTPAPRRIIASAIAQPAGGLVLVLDNRGARAQPLVLHAAGALQVQILRSTRAGVASETLVPAAGRAALSLPGESVLAVSASP
jgi:hypothetical protein